MRHAVSHGRAATNPHSTRDGCRELVHPMARAMVVMVKMADFMAVMLVSLSG
jgi:hypothetical protein